MAKKKKSVHTNEKRAEKKDFHTNGKPGGNHDKSEQSDKAMKEEAANEEEFTDETAEKEESSDDGQDTALDEKLKETENKYLRLAAEFDNYRKRTFKEKADLTRYAGEDILTGLLPVIDDFERAIESINNTQDVVALKKGIELIHGKFKEFLKQRGVKEIEAMGDEFDTDLHEAVTKIPAKSKKEKGKIVDVIEKGYLLYDKVIRFSKVVIGE